MALQQAYWLSMSFKDRLVALRKEKKLTQQILAGQVGVHVVQIRRYEGGDSQPTLEVIRKLAVALSVSADVLIFDRNERGPSDDFRMQFESLRRFTDEEKKIAKQLLDSLILQHTANQLSANK